LLQRFFAWQKKASFSENGDKKPSTFRMVRQVNGQFLVFSFSKLSGGE